MKIVNLIENTPGVEGCVPSHGLSFYVETGKHRILFDTGPSEETLRNAERLGVDLRDVDAAILSHGHYDHSGGLVAFARINPSAVILSGRKILNWICRIIFHPTEFSRSDSLNGL